MFYSSHSITELGLALMVFWFLHEVKVKVHWLVGSMAGDPAICVGSHNQSTSPHPLVVALPWETKDQVVIINEGADKLLIILFFNPYSPSRVILWFKGVLLMWEGKYT